MSPESNSPALSEFVAGGPLANIELARASAIAAPLSASHYKKSPDDWAIDYWLRSSASKSTNTLRAYRKEISRWRAFLATVHGDIDREDHLESASYDDAAKFIAWIEYDGEWPLPPEVAARYRLGPMQAKKPKSSPSVLRQAVIILHGMYEELSKVAVPGIRPLRKCCELNPFKPYRKLYSKDADDLGGPPTDAATKSKADRIDAAAGPDAPGAAKALTDPAWAVVWEIACELPPDATARKLREAARQRLIISVLRATWERRHAIAGILWSHLQQSRGGMWKLRRKRKGKRVTQSVPIPASLMDEIGHFRAALGMSTTPTSDEGKRSIFWIGGRSAGHDGPVSDETIYRTVKTVFDTAAERMKAQGEVSLEEELNRARKGPHTIRHTMATQYLEAGGDIRYAQEALGHSSIVITSRTYDSKHDQRQAIELEKQWITSSTRPGRTKTK